MKRPQKLSLGSLASGTSSGGTSLPSATPISTRHAIKDQRLGAEVSDERKREKPASAFSTSSLPSRVKCASCCAPSDRGVQKRPCLFAVMQNMGSLYEEMARQLESTGKWVSVLVRRSCPGGELVVAPHGRPMRFEDVILLLGEKIPAEEVVESRRLLFGGDGKHFSRRTREIEFPGKADGLCVVNCVEKLRCITLKGSMVSTLLAYHSKSWKRLGEYLPLTFRIIPRKPGSDERNIFLREVHKKSNCNALWIAKSSSGCHGDGVEIFLNTKKSVTKMLKYIDGQREPYMWVVQLYIDRPLLYHRRKFDIRCWVLLCADRYEIYVYEQLVMRMSSVEYSQRTATTRNAAGRLAHITNHCVQAQGEGFEAFEKGNELWKEHLDAVVRYRGRRLREKGIMHDGANPDLEPTLENTILPQIHHTVVETLLAAQSFIPNGRSPLLTPCFQVLGYDFLIDEKLRAWLLEINGAPGVADRLLPALVADTIQIALAPFFPNLTEATIRQNGITQHNGYVKVYP